MSKHKALWNTKENAEAYDTYARNFPMYQDTSRDLVAISGIKPGMTMVDLAAGTGATTKAILDKTDGNVHIIAVDQAEEMLKKAREKFVGKDVRFIVSEAEELDQVIHELVDAILCNSAFWQMKARAVFQAVSHVLKVGGVFVFNLPNQFFSFPDFQKKPRTPLLYDMHTLVAWGEEAGLFLAEKLVKRYEKSAEEVRAFRAIPVMKPPSKKEDGGEGVGVPTLPTSHEWLYLVFRKK